MLRVNRDKRTIDGFDIAFHDDSRKYLQFSENRRIETRDHTRGQPDSEN